MNKHGGNQERKSSVSGDEGMSKMIFFVRWRVGIMCVTLTQVIIVRCQALQKEALAIMGHKTTVCKYTHIFTLNKKATLFVGIGLFSALSAVWTRLAVFPSMYVCFFYHLLERLDFCTGEQILQSFFSVFFLLQKLLSGLLWYCFLGWPVGWHHTVNGWHALSGAPGDTWVQTPKTTHKYLIYYQISSAYINGYL